MLINHVTENNNNRASFRYRILIPSRFLPNECAVNVSGAPNLDAINVYHKHRTQHFDMIRNSGGIMDVTDDHFDHGRKSNHYQRMCRAADLVTCCTETLAERIKESTGICATVIPDPYELPEAIPKWSRHMDRWCWFGSQLNLDTMKHVVVDGPLEIVTGEISNATRDVIQRMSTVRVKVTPWSILNLTEALDRADFVAIPQHLTKKGMAKSANRAVEALRRGKMVIATPIPALKPLSEFILYAASNAKDYSSAATWVRANVEYIQSMIIKGQAYVAENYTPTRIASLWWRVFKTQSGLRKTAN